MRPVRLFLSLRLLLLAAAGLALWLTLLSFPVPADNSLDASWQSVLTYAHGQPWLFGRDIIFTFGPWGFLTVIFHAGGTLWPKILWELIGKLVFAVVLVRFSARLPAWRRWVFLAAVLLLAGLFPDTIYFLFLTVVVLELLLHPGPRGGKLIFVVIALAFLAELKFTYTLLSAFGVAIIVVDRLAQKRWRAALTAGAVAVAAYLGFWLAAGQSLAKLPNYFRYSWQISTGYASAMALDESWMVFLCGAAALACSILYGAAALRSASKQWNRILTVVFLFGTWFLVWKHGFIRADGHVLGFFIFCFWLALALPPFFRPGRAWWLGGAALCCLLGCRFAASNLFPPSPGSIWQRLTQNGRVLLHPVHYQSDWRLSLAANERAFALPAVRAAIGSGRVDVFNYEQSVALLNGLRYAPRPVFQSYSAYTPALISKNLGYYRGPKAPDFVLFKLQTIDDRFPTQDDSLLLAALPLRYDFTGEVGGFLIGQKKASPPARLATEHEFISSFDAPLGQSVTVPPVRDHAVWVVMHLPLTWLGRLRALFYRPPILHLAATDTQGKVYRYRVVPPIAREGFLLNPFIETQADYEAFARGRGTKWIQSIRLEAEPGEAEFWGPPTVSFFVLPALPIAAFNIWQSWVHAGVSNLAPLSVQASAPVKPGLADRAAAVFVPAPSEIVFQPNGDMRTLRGAFGIHATDENHAHDDAVEFVVSAIFDGGRRETLYRTWLDPQAHPQDRYPHTFKVEWRKPVPERIILQTFLDPNSGNGENFPYWSRLSFQP